MKYITRICRAEDRTIVEVIEYTRQRFTKRDHNNHVSALTYWAACGCEFNHLVADVLVADETSTWGAWSGRRVLRYETKTVVDGSTIDIKLYLNGIFLRKINIAC